MTDAADPFLRALRPHYADALRYCRGLCARWSPSEAEDAFQSALLKAVEAFPSLRDPAAFRPWLFRIVTTEVRMAQRRHLWRRFSPLPPDDAAGPLGLVTPPATGEARDLLDALGRLGRREREALLLYEVGGFSVEEVREVQGDRSASAVKSRLARARARLRGPLHDPIPSASL